MDASVKICNSHRKWSKTMSFDHVVSSKYGDFIQKNNSHREIQGEIKDSPKTPGVHVEELHGKE